MQVVLLRKHQHLQNPTGLPKRQHLSSDVFRPPTLLLATCEGHHTVGALFVAAIDDIHPRCEVAVTPRDTLRAAHKVARPETPQLPDCHCSNSQEAQHTEHPLRSLHPTPSEPAALLKAQGQLPGVLPYLDMVSGAQLCLIHVHLLQQLIKLVGKLRT
jgi:hypothetical protein